MNLAITIYCSVDYTVFLRIVMEIPVPIAQIKLEPSGSGTVGLHGRSTPTVPQTSHEIKREMQSYMSVMKNTVGGKTLIFFYFLVLMQNCLEI